MRSIDRLNYLFWTVVVVALASCETLDPDEPSPIMLEINSLEVEADPETEGTSRHDIFDATVYHDGNIVATVPLPARIPVLQSKGNEILVFPGIKESATSTNRTIYPFLDPDTLNLEFLPGKIYQFDALTLRYKRGTKFLMLEDFESDVFGIQPTPEVVTDFYRTKDPSEVFEGEASLKAVITKEQNVMGLQTFGDWQGTELRTGSPVYLEMNYKNDVVLQIGYFFSNDDVEAYNPPFLFLRESEEWKKVYINLTDDVSVLADDASFKIYFSALLPADSLETATILLDNIKILTFE